MACGASHGLEFSSCRAMSLRRIEGGILSNLTDMTPNMTPFEAGLAPFIEMDKGDFIGRDALVGKDTRSCLFGITCETATPASGAVVLDGDVAVGHVTAGIPSPTLGLGVGYVRFDAPGDWVGRSLTMRLPDGSIHDTQIVDVPFFLIVKRQSFAVWIVPFLSGQQWESKHEQSHTAPTAQFHLHTGHEARHVSQGAGQWRGHWLCRVGRRDRAQEQNRGAPQRIGAV